MNLMELKVATYIYGCYSGYDDNYKEIMDLEIDLRDSGDLQKLYTFLRSWGCRNFKIADDTWRNSRVVAWYGKYERKLPDNKAKLSDISDAEIRGFSSLVSGLMACQASRKEKAGQIIDVSFGPVGAAKTLFALRKNVFAPWDNAIIDSFADQGVGITKTGSGYCEYLIYIKNQLTDIKRQLKKGERLSTVVGRPHSSPPKIIDEYLWVTRTAEIDPRVIIDLIRT